MFHPFSGGHLHDGLLWHPRQFGVLYKGISQSPSTRTINDPHILKTSLDPHPFRKLLRGVKYMACKLPAHGIVNFASCNATWSMLVRPMSGKS